MRLALGYLHLWLVARSERGASVVEYALIVVGVGLGLVLIVEGFQAVLAGMFQQQVSSMEQSP